MIKTFTLSQGWKLVIDTSEVIADDPGAGTPALLYGPSGQLGTLWCAQSEGECDGARVPRAVLRELDELEDAVSELLNA